MTNEEIKIEKEQMFKMINIAQKRIEELQAICKHEKTFVGTYQWRIGSLQEGEICEYCGKFIG